MHVHIKMVSVLFKSFLFFVTSSMSCHCYCYVELFYHYFLFPYYAISAKVNFVRFHLILGISMLQCGKFAGIVEFDIDHSQVTSHLTSIFLDIQTSDQSVLISSR